MDARSAARGPRSFDGLFEVTNHNFFQQILTKRRLNNKMNRGS